MLNNQQINFAENASAAPVSLGQEALDTHKQTAHQRLTGDYLPAAKTELWRAFSIASLRGQSYSIKPESTSNAPELPSWVPADSPLLIVSNGVIGELQNGLAGLVLTDMDAQSVQEVLSEHQVRSSDGLTDLNLSQTPSAKTLNITQDIDKPIVIWHQSDAKEALNVPLIKIQCDERTSATVIEVFAGGGSSLSIPHTAIDMGQASELEYLRWHQLDNDAALLGALSVQVESSAMLNANCFNTSGHLLRLDAEVTIKGSEADVHLNGLSLVDTGEQVGLVYRVNHPEPESVSNQNVRVVVDGKAKHLYDGYIYVGHGANSTDASQDSKALLLTKMAQALANPRLEILTDDVSCAHGATVGFLDEDALFYLRSRGLSYQQAQAALVAGFVKTTLDTVTCGVFKSALEAFIQARYGA